MERLPNTDRPVGQDIAAMLARDILHVTFLHLQARWLDDVPGLRDNVAAIIREALIEERE